MQLNLADWFSINVVIEILSTQSFPYKGSKCQELSTSGIGEPDRKIMRQLIVFKEHFDWLLKLQILFAIHFQSVSVDIYPATLPPSKYSPSATFNLWNGC